MWIDIFFKSLKKSKFNKNGRKGFISTGKGRARWHMGF
jgi:hypothetical protein